MNIQLDKTRIIEFCRRNHISKLALFGSVLRNDFRPDSDVDVLVEFESGQGPGFIRLYQLEEELTSLMGGHKVDLVTPKFLNRRIRQSVIESAEVEYAER